MFCNVQQFLVRLSSAQPKKSWDSGTVRDKLKNNDDNDAVVSFS